MTGRGLIWLRACSGLRGRTVGALAPTVPSEAIVADIVQVDISFSYQAKCWVEVATEAVVQLPPPHVTHLLMFAPRDSGLVESQVAFCELKAVAEIGPQPASGPPEVP